MQQYQCYLLLSFKRYIEKVNKKKNKLNIQGVSFKLKQNRKQLLIMKNEIRNNIYQEIKEILKISYRNN